MTSSFPALVPQQTELAAKFATADLTPEHLDEALAISLQVPRPVRHWPCYLQALALLGFQDWLWQRDADIAVNPQGCSLLNPAQANVLEAICNLQVGELTVCLLPMIGLLEKTVMLPRAVVELPPFMAQIYVGIGVDEDAETVAIRGFLRFDQLQSLPLVASADPWSYPLPLAQMNPDGNDLLLHLRCLAAAAIPLPGRVNGAIAPPPPAAGSAALPQLLPQLRTQNLQDVLSWDTGRRWLAQPDTLAALYQWQTAAAPSAEAALRLQEQLTLLTQTAINTATWLRGELDAVAQQLGLWQPQPLAAALRWSSLEERFQRAIDYAIRDDLEDLPPAIAPTFYEIPDTDPRICVCSVAWPAPAAATDWCLLWLIGTESGEPLPAGTELRVSTLAGLQDQQSLAFDSAFLYTTVAGMQEDACVLTLQLPAAAPRTLPPYTFNPGTMA